MSGPVAHEPVDGVDRLEFVLAGQEHADHYLTPLADPAGKSVLVVGSGAGTDILWCLRHRAREVVGIDVAEQDQGALAAAAECRGVDAGRASFRRLAIEDAPAALGRRFDLVLSNNVFEHVGDLAGAFAACSALVEPGRGRIALFSSPLYWSSAGSHLPHAPWEHLWADGDELRRRLLADGSLPAGHPLERLDLVAYLDREISLNRARVADFVAALGAGGLAALHLQVLPDPALRELPDALDRMRSAGVEAPAVFDLAAAGIAMELALAPEGSTEGFEPRSTFEERLAEEREAVHGSLSFRLGRALTAPLRRLRDLGRRR